MSNLDYMLIANTNNIIKSLLAIIKLNEKASLFLANFFMIIKFKFIQTLILFELQQVSV